MRTKRPVIASVIALGLLMVSSSSVLAQLTVPEQTEYHNKQTVGFGDSILGVTPVLDAPFSGEVLTTWQPRPNSGRSEWRARARYYRDRSGRVRVEQMFIGHAAGWNPQRVIVTADINVDEGSAPNRLPLYLLDPVARTATKVPRGYARMTVGGSNTVEMPISHTCFIGFVRPQRMNRTLERNGQAKLVIDEESLGQQTMGGVQVAGTRFTTTVPAGIWNRRRDVQMTHERWVSSELKLEVYDRSEDSQGEVIERRLTNISRAEPPAELFEVPADYNVMAWIGDTLWLNPDVPEIWPAGASPAERCLKPWP